MRRTVVIAVVALCLGLALGFVLGRWWLEREWSQPIQLLRSDSRRGADPTPAAGTRGLHPMPYARSRPVLAEFVARDPVVMSVGSVGRYGETVELHLTLRNRGRCSVRSLAGVAYGFDAFGRPARMNAGGENFVAFNGEFEPVASGESTQFAVPLHHVGNASLVLAHVDHATCVDGPAWHRPT